MTSPTNSPKHQKGSTAYINGRIYTVNPSQPWASGFIVSPEGVFTHIGSTSEIQLLAKETGAETIDLKNHFIMPGIHDAHIHLLHTGLALTSNTRIPANTTHENIAERIKSGCCGPKYKDVYEDWIVVDTYAHESFPNAIPDRKYLDDMFPDQPLVLQDTVGHAKFLNTAALKRAGYDLKNEPDIQGSKFFRRPDGDDASLTGELGENAMNKAALAIPRPGVAHVKTALRETIRALHKVGVTSCQEASANTLILNALKELDDEGKLDINVATHIVYAPEFLAFESRKTLHSLLDEADSFKSKHVDTRFVKIILDGVPLPPLFTQAGLDDSGRYEKEKIIVEDFKEAILKYDERRMTVKIHCTGQGATRIALDAIEEARRRRPSGPRHEIAHCNGVHDDDYPRFAALNVTAEMSPAPPSSRSHSRIPLPSWTGTLLRCWASQLTSRLDLIG